MAEEWIEKVFEMLRVSDRIILVKLIHVVSQRVVTFCLYAPQSDLSYEVTALFFDQLRAVTARIPRSESMIPCGDWNDHVGYAGTEHQGWQMPENVNIFHASCIYR